MSLAVFLLGSLYKIIRMFLLIKKKEPFIFAYMNLKYSVRSILHWILPFAASNMRKHPVTTVISFIFHICVLTTPILLLSHIVLIEEYFNLHWPNLPDNMTNIMTIFVIGCCVFFLLRRLTHREVRLISTPSDYLLLILVAMPFITGYIAYHQWFYYPFFHILHIVSGEIFLIVLPFTRLNHMLFALLSRSYTGSEFGGVKHAKDW